MVIFIADTSFLSSASISSRIQIIDMNWVGGARNRLKLQNEKKQQKVSTGSIS